MKITIGIPTFNRAKFLKRALKSVSMQTYNNLEIVVSDNNSSDNTKEVVKEFMEKDNRIKYFRNERNLGMLGNWRKILYERTNGEYLMILCDDDYLIDKYFVEKMVNLINRHQNVVLAHANYKILYEFEKNRSEYVVEKPYSEVEDGKNVFFNFIKDKRFFGLPTVFFKTSILKEVSAFKYEGIKKLNAADVLEILKVSLNGKVAFLKEVVLVFSKRNDNLSNKILKDKNWLFEELIYLDMIFEYYVSKFPKDIDKIRQWYSSMLKKILNEGVYPAIVFHSSYKEKLLNFIFYFNIVKKKFPRITKDIFKLRNIVKFILSFFPEVYDFFRKLNYYLKNGKLPPPLIR